jgi:hypothetical protein
MKDAQTAIKEIQERARALGLSTSKYYIEEMKRILDPYQTRIPKTWNAMMGRKYILPNYRQDQYFSQELIRWMSLEFLLAFCQGHYGFDIQRDEVLNTKFITTCMAINHQWPTYWLESELAKPLLATNLPEDFMLDDVHWRFPVMRIYLPKGLLTIRRKDVDCSLMYLDIVKVDKDSRFTLAEQFKQELEAKGEARWCPTFMGPPDKDSIAVWGTIDVDCPEPAVGYATTCPITNTSIEIVYDQSRFYHIASPTPSDDLDGILTNSMLRLAFNILILMGSYPLEYDPNEVLRKAKQEGQRTIPALLKAKFVGQSLLRPRKKHATATSSQDGELRSNVVPHWVKGHWKRVAYGSKHSLRRLQWIGMYSQGDISKL